MLVVSGCLPPTNGIRFTKWFSGCSCKFTGLPLNCLYAGGHSGCDLRYQVVAFVRCFFYLYFIYFFGISLFYLELIFDLFLCCALSVCPGPVMCSGDGSSLASSY
jgi:hypothetical protein